MKETSDLSLKLIWKHQINSYLNLAVFKPKLYHKAATQLPSGVMYYDQLLGAVRILKLVEIHNSQAILLRSFKDISQWVDSNFSN